MAETAMASPKISVQLLKGLLLLRMRLARS